MQIFNMVCKRDVSLTAFGCVSLQVNTKFSLSLSPLFAISV